MARVSVERRSRIVRALAIVGLGACGGGSTGPSPPPPGPPPPPPPPPVGATVDLAPGGVAVLSDVASIRAFRLVSGSEGREHQVIVMSASQVFDGVTPLRFATRAEAASASAGPSGGRARGSRVASAPAGAAGDGALPDAVGTGAGRPRALKLPDIDDAVRRPLHLTLRARMARELRRVGARWSDGRPNAPPGGRASAGSRGLRVPSVGESLTLKSQTVPGGGITCNASTPIDGTVRSVGQNFVIVEEDQVAGLLTNADFAELETELDQFVAPVDQSYFGAPADLDGNGRTIALFTKEVNRLTPPGSTGIVIGFFSPLDLADPVSCPSSNEAEVVWLIAPDPNGDFGPPVSVAFVKRIARGLVAHEFQHMLNAEQRFVLGNGVDDEEAWINEGLSHVAEEVTGFHRVGAGTRANLGFSEIGIGAVERPAFDDFQAGNLQNVSRYLGSPHDVPAISPFDPGGTEGFRMRGFGYLFLRWLGDRFGPASPVGLVPGSGEDALFRALSSGGTGHATGIANVLAAIQSVAGETLTWDDVLSEYFAAPAVDDAISGLSEAVQLRTWNYPRLFDELQANAVPGLSSGYPLGRTIVSVGAGSSRTLSFDLNASAARYFTFSADGPGPDMLVELTAPSGANVPNGARARVVVVRTR